MISLLFASICPDRRNANSNFCVLAGVYVVGSEMAL